MKFDIKSPDLYKKTEYRKKGYWGDATLGDFWNMAVLRAPEKIAVMDLQGVSYTYSELDKSAEKLAAYLRENGIKPGDIVSFQLPGWSEFTLIYIACLKAGAIVNPILVCYRLKELTYILNKCKSKMFFCPKEYKNFDYMSLQSQLVLQVKTLKQIIYVEKEKKSNGKNTLDWIIMNYAAKPQSCSRAADDIAAVLFTSGTEGNAKGVMLTHNNILASEKAFTASLHITEFDTLLLPAPTAHAIGFHHGVTAAFIVGARSVLQDHFQVKTTLELIAKEKCTYCFGPTPFVYDIVNILKKEKYDISSLQFFVCGGAVIPQYMFKAALDVGVKLIDIYGSTESVPHSIVSYDKNIHGGSMIGIETKVVDEQHKEVPDGSEGEEASRGPNVFVGYLREKKLTALVLDDDGWYYSGDLCIKSNDGNIRITGRKKDIIIRGGENLSCTEIEHILQQHPNVKESGVVGMPDERLGERICAYVILYDLETGLTVQEVQKFFLEKEMTKAKCPERIEIVKNIPRTASGKIKKIILKQDIKNKVFAEKKEITESLKKEGTCYAS